MVKMVWEPQAGKIVELKLLCLVSCIWNKTLHCFQICERKAVFGANRLTSGARVPWARHDHMYWIIYWGLDHLPKDAAGRLQKFIFLSFKPIKWSIVVEHHHWLIHRGWTGTTQKETEEFTFNLIWFGYFAIWTIWTAAAWFGYFAGSVGNICTTIKLISLSQLGVERVHIFPMMPASKNFQLLAFGNTARQQRSKISLPKKHDT